MLYVTHAYQGYSDAIQQRPEAIFYHTNILKFPHILPHSVQRIPTKPYIAPLSDGNYYPQITITTTG